MNPIISEEILQIFINEGYINILMKLYITCVNIQNYIDNSSEYLANKYQLTLTENNFNNFIYQCKRFYYIILSVKNVRSSMDIVYNFQY